VVVGEGQECGRFGTGPWDAVGTYNATTSCPFALNVRKAYLAAGLDGGPGTIQAYSPTTKKDYTMTCSGSQPARCEGGVAARVMIYGGEFVLVTTTE
jgi:serine/threonine-protein kinase